MWGHQYRQVQTASRIWLRGIIGAAIGAPLRFGSSLQYFNCFLTIARTSEVIEESLVRGSFRVFQAARAVIRRVEGAPDGPKNTIRSERGAPVIRLIVLTA